MSDEDGWGGIGDQYKDRKKDTPETNETLETNETPGTPETSGTTETWGREPDDDPETNETPEMFDTSETTETKETDDTSETTNIKQEWNGRTIYLNDDLVNDVDICFDELALEAKREGRGEIKKERDFYPAVFRAALNGTSIEEELGFD